MPYIFFYSQSGVLATAVSYKLLVTVSDTGSMSDFVRENDIGKVFTPNSINELVESIKHFLKSDLEKYKQNEIKCKDKYSWQNIAKKTREFYNSVI